MRPTSTMLPVGMLRSYGDSVLNTKGSLVETVGLDRFMAFDPATGLLRAECGLTLDTILRCVVPRGYFLKVTPGTRFVTVGGAIANDVHGKNHHLAGTFGTHVRRIGLMRGDGSRIEVAPDSEGDLFAATIGGLGLTGLIEWAEFALTPIKSAHLDVETIPFRRLAEFWELNAKSVETHEHTVAWIDCTAKDGRGIFSRGNWRGSGDLSPHASRSRLSVPVEAPSWALNSLTVRTFNRAYFAAQAAQPANRSLHYAPFFYPLDGVAHWNRLYGRRGFWQYQCVLPTPTMVDAIACLLDAIAASGQGSFLAVLKTFGAMESPGLLSFPMPGATLALDFPNAGEQTLRLLERLDSIVCEAGGRLYAAKDGRLPKDMWTAGYPNLGRFLNHVDPAFCSDFWRRVGA